MQVNLATTLYAVLFLGYMVTVAMIFEFLFKKRTAEAVATFAIS